VISGSPFAAPPVNPSHSWILSAMNDKLVPGNPPLVIQGSLEAVQGGSRFDGAKSSLSGALPGTACVCDPDMCISGFAVGVKLKFSDESLTYNAPQYVIDTGASANNKGISVFLQLNSLYFKIVTSNAVYQVRLSGQITHSQYQRFHTGFFNPASRHFFFVCLFVLFCFVLFFLPQFRHLTAVKMFIFSIPPGSVESQFIA